MTYQRVVNRNRLAPGDYDKEPWEWHAFGTKVAWNAVNNPLALAHDLEEGWNNAAKAANGRTRILAGDLRRLEADAVDENATCVYIASRTGVDVDTVAIVLKEFLSW